MESTQDFIKIPGTHQDSEFQYGTTGNYLGVVTGKIKKTPLCV